MINLINQQATGITAALNSAGTGLVLTDTTGSTTGTLSASGATAVSLGVAGSVDASTLSSQDLHLRVLSDNTLLSSLNGGTGFTAGEIQLTDGAGNSAIVNLSTSNITTVGSVLAAINTAGTNIRASLNSQGNGILLTDTSRSGTAQVSEVDGGTTAASLNILGSFSGKTLDGSFQKSVTILGTDSLQDVARKINAAGIGVSASIINDGSGALPYRLSLTSQYSGAAGALIFNGSSIGLNSQQIMQGQNAVITYGGQADGAGGLQATSNSNTFSNLVPGLTVNLAGVGTSSVTVANDNSQVASSVQTFVTSYNKVVTDIANLTSFDASDPTKNGVLFGNATIEQLAERHGCVHRSKIHRSRIAEHAGRGGHHRQSGRLADLQPEPIPAGHGQQPRRRPQLVCRIGRHGQKFAGWRRGRDALESGYAIHRPRKRPDLPDH